MTTGYVKLQRSVWTDPDYTALDATAQRLYLLLISQPSLSHVGVLAYTPGRWARLAPDTTTEQVVAALQTLEARRFVQVDPDTEEVWVRSYMAHDELWRVHNGPKALAKGLAEVLSPSIRAAAQAALDALTGATGGATGGATPAPAVLQQPATSSQQPAASSRTPSGGAMVDGLDPVPVGEAAAAALETWLDWRVDTSGPRNPAGFRRSVRGRAMTEHLPALQAYTQQHPGATLADLCRDVLGMSALDVHRYGATRAARLQGVA